MTDTNKTARSRTFQGERSSEIYELLENSIYENKDDQVQQEQEQQQILLDEAKGIKHFHTIDSDVLFEKQLEKRKFIVEGLLPEGLTILSGDPKVGKSFFALSLSVSVAKGVPFLCFPTTKSNVLYFCFEDDEKRLQQRLFDMSDDNFTGLSFCNEVTRLGNGFIESVETYLKAHPDTKLIVVDTLNYIRPEKQGSNMYRDDYDDMIKLHRLTQQYGIALLIIHHNKKNSDEDDALRAISGSMGLSGGTDNCIIIKKPKKDQKITTMNVVGRDLQKFEMKIMQNENGVWFAAENIEISKKEISIVIQAVYLFFFMNSKHLSPLSISPTELSSALNEAFSISVPPTMIKKKLTADHEDLELLGLKFDYERTKQGRRFVFSINENFRSPKYIHRYDNFKFYVEVLSPEQSKLIIDDSGDRVTVENDSEQEYSSAVNTDSMEDKSGGDNELPLSENERSILFENVFGDSGDRLTVENYSEKNSSSTVNADDLEVKVEETLDTVSSEIECSDSSINESGDSSDASVTADSRCENNCQPVNLSTEDSKKQSNGNSGTHKKSSGKHKKKGGKKKHGKKH